MKAFLSGVVSLCENFLGRVLSLCECFFGAELSPIEHLTQSTVDGDDVDGVMVMLTMLILPG